MELEMAKEKREKNKEKKKKKVEREKYIKHYVQYNCTAAAPKTKKEWKTLINQSQDLYWLRIERKKGWLLTCGTM